MPIYQYSCEKCETEFEYILVNNQAEPTECDKCGGKLKKLLSVFGFRLLGEGWAKDNYEHEYTPSLAGTADKVKPVYSRKKVAKIMDEIKNSRKEKTDEEG